jgi:hypothetical protein
MEGSPTPGNSRQFHIWGRARILSGSPFPSANSVTATSSNHYHHFTTPFNFLTRHLLASSATRVAPLLTHTMASTTAQRRLFQEYKALSNNPPEGITAGPVSEDDLLYWEALIQGPEGTPFEGGVFPAELKFPKDYPLAPPSMRFLGEVWHPNGMFNS